MKNARSALSLLFAVSCPGVAYAQDLPDPATIQTPDVSASTDPKVAENGYKFYYFHKTGVTFERAYRDFSFCWQYLRPGTAGMIPGFVPWRQASVKEEPPVARSPYGLIGAGISAIVTPKIERGNRSNKMRRCMGTRGYERYAIPEETWNVLNEGDESKQILMQAKLASGPNPSSQPVTR